MKSPLPHKAARSLPGLSSVSTVLALIVVAPLVVLPRGYALPTGGQVAAGAATINQSGSRMTVDQSSRNAVVNWQSFSIGSGEQVRINQSGANAAMLARVTGNAPSQLLGSLTADGKLFLINPRGIVVGQGAVIDTAAFVGSTLNVNDNEFMRGGALNFQGDSDAGIVNYGQITAHEGNVMLFAHTVKNAGQISAPNGVATLAAATEAYLGSPDDPSLVVKFNLPKTTAKAGVENSGVIEAAQAELKAAGGSIYDLAINQAGIVRATGVETKNGRVLLTADGGAVGASGEVSAHNADGSGGEILVGGDTHGANASVANATHTVVTQSAKLDASATTAAGQGGKVVVWSDEATRFLGTIDAHGAGGGFAEVSGKHGLEFNPASPLNLGSNGTLLLDPDALIVSTGANSGTSTGGTNPFTFGAAVEPATLNVTTLQNQLATSNVILDTSTSAGDITFNTAVAWNTANTLTAKAGGSINLNANITAALGSLVLNPGKAAIPTTQGPLPINPKATLASGATITASTLTYGVNGSAAPAGYNITGGTGAADFQGNLNVGTLNVDLSNGGTGVSTSGTNNTIGTFRTTGTGDLTWAQVTNHHGALNVYLNSANASAPAVQITTPGLLTLQSGSSLSFANPTDVTLASTGSGFTNSAGASAFGTNARFLIYASTLGAVTKNGLTGSDVYSHPYVANDDVSSFTGNTFFYTTASGLPFLTYTADDKSRTYGASDPTFTATVTGFIGGLTNDVTGSPLFTTTASQSSGVGAYSINVARGTLASFNYDFTFAPGNLTITAAPLTITANNASRTPNTANPTFSASYSGFVLGQTSSVVSGLILATTATLSSPVGNYAITPSGATAANYSITYVPGSLSISNNNPLTITANDFTRTYGAANPTFTASMSGFIGTDTSSVVSGLQFSTAATQTSGVGAYAITPFGATAAGYSITYNPGLLTITRAPLVITPNNASRLYGDANPAFTANFSGLVAGDTSAAITGLSLATSATQLSNVGAYPITASGASNPNYTITYGANGQLSVTPAPITVKFDDKTRVYGDANPTLTYTVTGLKNSDTAATSVSVSNVTTIAAVTDGIGAYGINGLVLPLSSNYSATGVGGDLTITPRPLTITAPSFSRQYYTVDPISSPDLADATLKADAQYAVKFSGLAQFDTAAAIPDVKLTTEATLRSGVSKFGILVSSGLNRNYAISYQFGSLEITPRPLFFNVGQFTKTYGTANPDFTPTYDHGLAPIDTVAGLGLQVDPAILSARNVGAYDVNYRITNPNYQLFNAKLSGPFFNAPLASQLKITPAPLTVTVAGNGRLYGNANPALEVQVLGLAFGETANDVLSISNPTTATTSVGRYAYNVALKGATPNYTIADNRSGMFQINPRLLTLAIDVAARYYGDPNPAFTYKLGGDGLASFDSFSALADGLKTATPTTATTDVGIYRIDPAFKTNANYLVSWTPGYLAILPRPIEIVVNNGIAFGNNHIPAGFTVGDTGLDLVLYSNPGTTGNTVKVTNLPDGVSFKDVAPNLTFQISSTNAPSAVSSVLTPEQFVAQFKSPATTPTDPTPSGTPPTNLPGETAVFTPGTLPSPTVPSEATVITIPDVIVLNSVPIINPTPGQKKDERFADGKAFILPVKYGNKNYAVTKITNGVLTMKSDPVVVNATLSAEEAKRKKDEARDGFLDPGKGGMLAVPGAYGFSKDMYPLIFQALGLALDQAIKDGDTGEGSIVRIIHGDPASSIDQISSDEMFAWLHDFHTNPAKQALFMPLMINYAMTIAYQDPAKWTPVQAKLMDMMKPFIAKGRQDFIDSAKSAQADWNTAHDSAGGLAGGIAGAYGLEVTPYEKFVGAAVESTVTKAFAGIDEQFKAKTAGMTQQELAGYTGLAASGATAAVVGTVAGTLTAKNMMKILPNTAKDIKIAAEALSKTITTAKDATEATEAAARGTRAIATVETLSNMIAGPAEIISFAIEAGITQGMRAGEEDKQKDSFAKLLNSGSDPVSPHDMMQNDVGRAEMMLGLMAMFSGGNS